MNSAGGNESTLIVVGIPKKLAKSPDCPTHHVDVSKNNGTPKSSILIGFSIINHPFWDAPIFGNTHVLTLGQESLWFPSDMYVAVLREVFFAIASLATAGWPKRRNPILVMANAEKWDVDVKSVDMSKKIRAVFRPMFRPFQRQVGLEKPALYRIVDVILKFLTCDLRSHSK